MTRLTWLKVALAGIGLAIFMYGHGIDSSDVRWLGIALVAAAFVLRFVGRRDARTDAPREDDDPGRGPPGP